MPNNLSLCISCLFLLFLTSGARTEESVTVYTVATENTHGLQRYIRSAAVYNINVKVLGLGQQWMGGDMNHPGGGQKIHLLKEELNVLAPDNQHIIIFTDSYDVIFLSGIAEILTKFKNFGARVVFSAEPYCWPDSSLAVQYPPNEGPNAFLNSGAFIGRNLNFTGYLPELLKILNNSPIDPKYDDQLYYTKIYLDKNLRDSLKISLDSYGVIFQNLNGALSDVQIMLNGTESWPYLENVVTRQRPSILHGNGPSKLILNNYGHYLAKSWSTVEGCAHCREKRITLKEDALPEVMLAIFVEQATPFFEEFLKQIEEIDYPKSKLHLLLRNNVEYHEQAVDTFYNNHSKKYATAKRIKPSDFITEAEARNIAKERCLNGACEYMFSVDSLARVHKRTLRYLLSSGYDVIAPLIVRSGQAWSNFWGAINAAGYYARSHDYMEIVEDKRRGIWNVPYISDIYLVKMSILKEKFASSVTFYKKEVDSDMIFCESLRNAGIFMHVSNEIEFGHLVNPETFDVSRTFPDIYQVIENRVDWEARYLHENYSQNFEENRKHLMPCPDVYWFPLMKDRFCDEWIAIMEAFGKWSAGSNYDERLATGYEAVPTRDIHMNQVGLDVQWLYVLKEYVRPLQEMVFIGHYVNPPVSIMNFVVRYRPDEQPSLKPHHDSSTYTINLALNTPHVDYEGGGCRFIRYNCSVQNTKKGWLLMHPGRLTHYHEGLVVTNGTRYIMISFVDP